MSGIINNPPGGPVMSSVFGPPPTNATNEMAAGVRASFGVLSLRGGKWHIKHRGTEQTLMRPPATPGGPPDGPVASLDVIVVKASPAISKIWYENAYIEGANAQPDCFSIDGVRPDMTSRKRQSDTCAMCPQNRMGSKMLPSGKPTTACANNKRLAIVHADDPHNEKYGGPLLLRVPGGSLNDMANYSTQLQQQGFWYYGVVTNLSFDPTVAYPKLIFRPVRSIDDATARIVVEFQKGPLVQRILSEAADMVPAEGEPDNSDMAPPPMPSPPATTASPPPPPPPPPATPAGNAFAGFPQAATAPPATDVRAAQAAMPPLPAFLDRGQPQATALPQSPGNGAMQDTAEQRKIRELEKQLADLQSAASQPKRRSKAAGVAPPSPQPTEPVAAEGVLPPPTAAAVPSSPSAAALEENLDNKLATLLGSG